jgi:hypothetical protein
MKTSPNPSTPLLRSTNPNRVTFTRSEFTSFFSLDQALTSTPSTEDIADANRTFTVMLHWGIFKEISPGSRLYEIVPELMREFPLRVFERFEVEKSRNAGNGGRKEGGV